MTIPRWRVPDYQPQGGDTAETFIDKLLGNLELLSPWGRNFACYPNDPADMTVFLEPGGILSAGARVEQSAAQQSPVIAQPGADQRIDLVVFDGTTGALEIVTGTESATPVAPALPAGKLPSAELGPLLPSTTAITADLIKDARRGFVTGGIAAASQAEMEAASSDAVAATPANMGWHPGVAKFWVKFSMSGTWSIQASHNVLAVVDDGTGVGSVTIDTDFSGADYAVTGINVRDSSFGRINLYKSFVAPTAGSFPFQFAHNDDGTPRDVEWVSLVGYGDQ